ncbi:hypothetical protein JB92DRAFT_3141871 [Gautieria morchelliformis]|nr:hypothetical protein JB92DRAFT_3141871 [Gautieria morchelliformis]
MNTNMQLPRLQDLYLDYPLAEEDYRQLRLPPLIARPRTATPPLPIPATPPARSRRQRGARKTKAIKGREAQGPTARGGSSPRKTYNNLLSSVPQLSLSPDILRTSRPLVINARDHGEQSVGFERMSAVRGRGAKRRARLIYHQYDYLQLPDGRISRREWIS